MALSARVPTPIRSPKPLSLTNSRPFTCEGELSAKRTEGECSEHYRSAIRHFPRAGVPPARTLSEYIMALSFRTL